MNTHETLILTARGLHGGTKLRSAVRRAAPEARIRSTGFRGVYFLESETHPFETARKICRECGDSVGHVTVVLAEAESKLDPLKEEAARLAPEHVAAGRSFAFRIHKRGSHWLGQDSQELERSIGGAMWIALENAHGERPHVDLEHPDVELRAEVLGPVTYLGIYQATQVPVADLPSGLSPDKGTRDTGPKLLPMVNTNAD